MNLADARLAPSPGADGLVTRTGGAVLFVAGRTPVTEVARLVEAVESAADAPAPGRQLARAMATLVGADSGALPGFALVATSTGGIYVKAYGPVEVRVQGEGGEEVISAVGSFTGFDRELTGTFHTIVAHRAGEPVPVPAFDVDVRAGTTPGSGFALTTLTGPVDAPAADVPASAPEAAPEPGPAATEPPAAPVADGVPLDPPTQAWTPEEAAAATAAAEERAAAPVADGPEVEAAAPPAEAPSTAPPVEEPPTAPPVAEEPPTAPPVGEPPTAPPLAEPPPSAPPAAETPGSAAPPSAEPPGFASPPSAEPPGLAPPPSAEAAAPHPAEPPAFSPPADEPAPEPPPYEAATMPPTALPDFESHLLGALDDDEVDAREPLPVELDPGEVRAPDQDDAQEVIVQGVLCSRGHFNDPRSRFCSSCGISMVQNTQVLTPGPRPPLGVLVFEDGATFSLSQDYVVGRQPEVSEAVQQGLALPIPVDDPERSISRAHAELRLVDWEVHLINLSATNGSFVWDETQQQWVPIPTGQSVVLSAGMRVALGRRSAVFESSLVR